MLLLSHVTLHDAILVGLPYALLLLTGGVLVGVLIGFRIARRSSGDASGGGA